MIMVWGLGWVFLFYFGVFFVVFFIIIILFCEERNGHLVSLYVVSDAVFVSVKGIAGC